METVLGFRPKLVKVEGLWRALLLSQISFLHLFWFACGALFDLPSNFKHPHKLIIFQFTGNSAVDFAFFDGFSFIKFLFALNQGDFDLD